MDVLVWSVIIAGALLFTIVGGIFAFSLYKKSFKNRVIIFRRTGKEGKDVIIIEDKFRVSFRDGLWIIEFYMLKEKTKSISGNYWFRFLSNQRKKEVLKYTQDEWDKFDLSDKVQRGLLLYETREGNYHPMVLNVDEQQAELAPDFSQDDRAFQARQTEEAAMLTRNKRTEKMLLLAIIIGIIGIVVIGGAGFYFMQKNGQANVEKSALVCAEYARSVINITKTGSPTFLDTVVAPVIGG